MSNGNDDRGGGPLLAPKDSGRIETYGDMLRCVLRGREATYVSVPITTGRRFIEWYKHRGRLLGSKSDEYRDEHRRKVVEPNCDAARRRLTALRRQCPGVVIEPTAFERPEWDQDQYRYFWGRIIELYARRVVFLDGWEYSSGCSYEFLVATRSRAETLTEEQHPLDGRGGLLRLRHAIAEMKAEGLATDFLEAVARELESDPTRRTDEAPPPPQVVAAVAEESRRLHFKDAVLDMLATIANVAQFVSFEPHIGLTQRFSRIAHYPPNHRFPSAPKAVAELLRNSPDESVNVRCFRPDRPKGEKLEYGLKSVDDVMAVLHRLAAAGLHTIVNETVDVKDGGVSGVALGGVIEFAPDSTPQAVDEPEICSLPRRTGLRILHAVYGFRPAVDFEENFRVEFSIHPRCRGLRHEHTIIWELESVGPAGASAVIRWPNRFSRLIGDKAFGLLVADAVGLPVPKTTVLARVVAPFTFGRETGTAESWIRTAPAVRDPGRYATYYGWRDPFKLVSREERRTRRTPGAVPLASVLAQESVHPQYAGAMKGSEPEGVRGRGDQFMVGAARPEPLPQRVVDAVRAVHAQAVNSLGPVEFEWVYDGSTAWLVQLHVCRGGRVQVQASGAPSGDGEFRPFDVTQGLDGLRQLIAELTGAGTGTGIALVGDVGISSHFGDLLREAGLPWRIERPT